MTTQQERSRTMKFLKYKLRFDAEWSLHALHRLCEADATSGNVLIAKEREFLRSVNNFRIVHTRVSQKQLIWVQKKLHKYAEVIYSMSDIPKLNQLAQEWDASKIPL